MAAEQITLKLSGLEVVLLSSPKALAQLKDSPVHSLMWLQFDSRRAGAVSRLAQGSLRWLDAMGGGLDGVWVSAEHPHEAFLCDRPVHRLVAGFQKEVPPENQVEAVLTFMTQPQNHVDSLVLHATG